MDSNFWHQKWKNDEIGFHEGKANALLVKYASSLSLASGSRVFVPLCGKTLDIAWLLNKGYRVAGVELVEMAVKQLFEELDRKPAISKTGRLKRYHAPGIDVFASDIFDLSRAELGPVDAVYDRAAFVALPEAMRTRYISHVADITDHASQLLITFEYDRPAMEGPPFSFSEQEVKEYYRDHYEPALLTSEPVEGGLKGHPAKEYVWLLQPHTN